jgi:hypothetical protein
MIQRDYIQENRYDMGTSGTLTFNLDFSDPISELSLLFEATNGASGNKDNPPEINISKIELVDGGEVLWDSPGVIAFGVWSQLNGSLPHCYRSGAVSDSIWTPINLLFGRYLYDKQFAFNPSAHRNPQLKITFDEATTRAAGATGFVSDSWNVSILVKLMEQAESPLAFLAMREVESYTSLASGDSKTELPTDRLIRFIATRVYESGTHMENHVTNYKLSVDGGKHVPFDLLYRNMRDKTAQYFKPLKMPQYTQADDMEWHQSWMGDGFYATIRSHVKGDIATAASHSGGRLRVQHTTHAGVDVDANAVHFAVEGYPLHHTFIYPFGRLNDPVDWLDPTGYKKLDYILTQGNAGAAISVNVQQVYPY